MLVFLALMLMLIALFLCLCASANSIRQISGFVLLMFLLMLTLMSRVFSLVMLMLCLCASDNQPLHMMVWKAIFSIEDQVVFLSKFS